VTTILWIICLVSFGIVVAFWLWFAIASHKLTAYPSSNEKPGVSVIVVYKNEGKNIINLIERALAQNYPNFEVIAIDDFSTDDGSAQLSKIQDSKR
jgi:chlorobactene glucosyltransferase